MSSGRVLRRVGGSSATDGVRNTYALASMGRTLPEQIAANRRASLVFSFLIVLLVVGLCTAIAGFAAPRSWYVGTLAGFGLGFLMSVIAGRMGSSLILRMSGAREATAQEDRMLRNVVEEMAIASGVPMPKVYVIDEDAPNAFATGRGPDEAAVAITRGLLRKLDRDELQGVMAHELAHIRNDDIKFMTTVALTAGLVPMLADGFRMMTWFGGGRRDDDDRESNQLQLVFMILGLVLAILAPIFSMLLQFAVSRKREYLADATAAEMTRYPEGLARALAKISSDPEELHAANRATQHMYIVNPLALDGGGSDLFSTHPPTGERIRALMGLAGNAIQAPPPRVRA